jgi:hypothetical protein
MPLLDAIFLFLYVVPIAIQAFVQMLHKLDNKLTLVVTMSTLHGEAYETCTRFEM